MQVLQIVTVTVYRMEGVMKEFEPCNAPYLSSVSALENMIKSRDIIDQCFRII